LAALTTTANIQYYLTMIIEYTTISG